MVQSISQNRQKLAKLVDSLIQQKVIKTEKVGIVMKAVDRMDFMPAGTTAKEAYFDSP